MFQNELFRRRDRRQETVEPWKPYFIERQPVLSINSPNHLLTSHNYRTQFDDDLLASYPRFLGETSLEKKHECVRNSCLDTSSAQEGLGSIPSKPYAMMAQVGDLPGLTRRDSPFRH